MACYITERQLFLNSRSLQRKMEQRGDDMRRSLKEIIIHYNEIYEIIYTYSHLASEIWIITPSEVLSTK